MRKALIGLLITLGVLVPALASAHGGSKPPKDTTPPSITSIHIESNNASTTRAKAGDTVTLTFTTSEKIQTPIVLVETKTLFVRALNTSDNTWAASYTVNSRDPLGKVDYLIMIADTSNNAFACSSVRLPIIKYCPTTDSSSVTVYKETTPPPPPPADITPPVIEAHVDVFATTTETSVEVTYTLPTANDNKDGAVTVACVPTSGSTFSLGTTTVQCGASDTAGNAASSTFSVIVTQILPPPPPPPPAPYTMASQSDDSYLCGEATGAWSYCDFDGTFAFTDDIGGDVATIDLGAGSNMGTGTLQTVTIAKDPAYSEFNAAHPWLITIHCYTNAGLTTACPDWSTISDNADQSTDGTYWHADFSALNRTFNPAYYYVMTIDDTGWPTPAFGSESLQEAYWVITGLR